MCERIGESLEREELGGYLKLSADYYDAADLPRSVKPFGVHDGKAAMTETRI